MLAIEVVLLTGRYIATAHNDRTRSEWPPHPARLFSTLVAAWADGDPPDRAEREALAWLETLGDPEIVASPATERSVVTHFVPVNDAAVVTTYVTRAQRALTASEAMARATSEKERQRAAKDLAKQRSVEPLVAAKATGTIASAVEMLPERRPKQPRTFPSVTPEEPAVVFRWPDASVPEPVWSALDAVCARVTRLGHSSSLVSCRLVTDDRPAGFVPDPDGLARLRSVRPGQLEALERLHARHRGSSPRSLPATGVGYRVTRRDTPDEESPSVVVPATAGDWQVVEFAPESRNRPVTSTVAVARALRGAILRHASDPRAEGLAGHRADRSPTLDPHVGFVPLPFVGFPHANGLILGAAIHFPVFWTDGHPTRRDVFRALAEWERTAAVERGMKLTFGTAGVVRLTIPTDPAIRTLQRERWSRPSTTWMSVTPVALSRHPGSLTKGSAAKRRDAWRRAEDQILDECAAVDLPAPVRVELSLDPLVAGSAPAPRFPAFIQRDHRRNVDCPRALVHVGLEFDTPVVGPVLLGSGRFFGLGLLQPGERSRV